MGERSAGGRPDTGGPEGERPLVGRDAETERLLRPLAPHRQDTGPGAEPEPGHERVLLVTGAPGVGKTALLEHAARHAGANGRRVLRAAGSETERHLAFAGLHQLLRPVLDGAGRLPRRQRTALLGAFGLDAAPEADSGHGSGPDATPGPLLIGLAVLTLLSDLAGSAPLLVLVDDAQWLDRGSLDALSFTARRMDGEPVAMIVGARDGAPLPWFGREAPVLALEPLGGTAAGRLLDDRPLPPTGRARQRILEQAEGNPLALIELARAAEAGRDLPDGAPPTDPPPLTERLERVFAAHLDELPESTRRALLLLAVADAADPLAPAPAGPPAGDDKAWIPAEEAGLVRQSGGRPRFRHPLVRSAVHHAASPAARREAHLALAGALSGEPDRRAWHLAAAATGPDAEVAAALERTADRARRSGGYEAAAMALERAADLSPDRGERLRLLVAASRTAVLTGRLAWVEDLATRARGLTDDPALRAAAALGVGRLTALTTRHTAAFSLLSQCVEELAEPDPDTALEALAGAAVVRFYSGEEYQEGEVRRLLARLGDAPSGEPLRVWVRAVSEPFAHRAELVPLLPGLLRAAGQDAGRLTALAIVAWLLDETPLAVTAFDRAFDRWQSGNPLPSGLGNAAGMAYLDQGRWARTRTTAADVADMAAAGGLDHAAACGLAVDACALALRGGTAAAREGALAALSRVDPLRSRSVAVYARRALGTAATAEGDWETAFDQLRAAFTDDGGPVHYHASYALLADLAAAAARAGRSDEARGILERAVGRLADGASPRLAALTDRGRALLAEPGDAEPYFSSALADPAVDQWPFERALTRLDYAEWLRRQRRIAEARPLLTAALDTFQRLGAAPWEQRARAELRASGIDAVAPPAAPDALAGLSPQQQRIIRLAARGMTNREIGERLFLSPRTVGSHLYRSFPKLGITARSQLRDVVERGAETLQPRAVT